MNLKKTIILITVGIITAVLISVILTGKTEKKRGIHQSGQNANISVKKADNNDDEKEKAKKKCMEECKKRLKQRIAICDSDYKRHKDTKKHKECLGNARSEYDACKATCD